MEETASLTTTISAIVGVTAVVFAWLFYILQIKPEPDGETENGNARNNNERKQKAGAGKKKAPKPKMDRKDSQTPQFAHPWLVSTLKGHTESVTQLKLSPNNHFLASCGEDRTVRLWYTKDFTERNHRQLRTNIPFDSAAQVDWSPDNKAFLIAKKNEQIIDVFKITKKEGSSLGSIQGSMQYIKRHNAPIVGLGIACNGKFVMSCSEDNQMIIWTLRGSVLEEKWISGTGLTVSAKLSQCGRFVAGCGTYTEPDLNIYEVKVLDNDKYIPMTVKAK